jgi:hypothetical protein
MIDDDTMKILKHMMRHRPDLCGADFPLHSFEHDVINALAKRRMKCWCQYHKLGKRENTPIWEIVGGELKEVVWAAIRSHPKSLANHRRNELRGTKSCDAAEGIRLRARKTKPCGYVVEADEDPRTLHWFARAV